MPFAESSPIISAGAAICRSEAEAKAMEFSQAHVLLAFAAALVTIALVVATAGSLPAAANRLRLILKITGRGVVIAGFALGAGMLAWGFAAHDQGLVLFSLLPIMAAILTSNFMRRNAIR